MASPRYEPVAQQTGAGRNLITSAQLDALVEDAARKGGDLERLKSARLRIERAGAALRHGAAPPTTAPMDESVEMREPIAPEPSGAIAGSHEQWFPEPEPEPDGSDTSDAPRWCAPPELTWLGRLLSNRDGGPTALSKALYAVHIVGTALNFVGTDYRRWMGYEGDTGFNIVSAWNEAHGQGWFTTKGNTTADDTHGNLRGTPVLLSSRPDVVLPLTRRCAARFQAVPGIRAS